MGGILVHHLLPAVHKDLESLDIQITVLALDHFISLAAREWPLGGVVRLWDLVILEGSSGLFACFLALLEMYFEASIAQVCQEAQTTTLDCTKAADVMACFKSLSLEGAGKEMNKILEHTRRWLPMIPPSVLSQLRHEVAEGGDGM